MTGLIKKGKRVAFYERREKFKMKLWEKEQEG